MLPFRTILHPTDFSVSSGTAFRFACTLARDSGARLIALHVMPPAVILTGEGLLLPAPPAQDWDRMRKQLEQWATADPKVHLEHRLVQGDAGPEILQAAQELKCDLIVIGTHGRTGLRRLVMGSVAEQVLRQAPCPVLTVKTPQPPEEAVAEAGKPAAASMSAR